MTAERELSLQNSTNRYQGLYDAAKTGLEALQVQVNELEQLREEEGDERAELGSQLKLAMSSLIIMKRSKAGLIGSLSRARKRLSVESVGVQSKPVQTDTKVNHMSRAEKLVVLDRVDLPRLKHVEVFNCPGEFGKPFYIRIPQTPGGAAEVGSLTVWRRAHCAMEVVELLACSKNVNCVKDEDLNVLWAQIIQLNQDSVQSLLKKNPGLVKQLFELSPMEANRCEIIKIFKNTLKSP